MATLKDQRDQVPEYPQYPFPQKGWHQLECFAAAFGQTRRQFLDNVNRYQVPKVSFGSQILLNSELLIARLCRKSEHDIETALKNERANNGEEPR